VGVSVRAWVHKPKEPTPMASGQSSQQSGGHREEMDETSAGTGSDNFISSVNVDDSNVNLN